MTVLVLPQIFKFEKGKVHATLFCSRNTSGDWRMEIIQKLLSNLQNVFGNVYTCMCKHGQIFLKTSQHFQV